METTIEQQVAMNEALVPSAQRLRIGRRNFRLLSNIQSEESTLQLVYDVLRRCPFYKAFLVTADVPEIYMQEFWAAANVYQHFIRFKMDNKITMETTIEQQVAMNEALVPSAQRLRSLEENFFEFRQTNQFARAALVDAYESDKIIPETYRETVTLKRRRDDYVDKDEEPYAGPNRGSKRRREGKEAKSTSAQMETATRSAGRSTQGSRSRQALASKSALAEEPMQTTSQMEEPSHPEFDTGADDQPIVQSSQHPEWFSQQRKLPTSDRDWNKTLSAVHESI
nr:hypothetical protein [Tanacetum cinerariifolium]